MTYYQETRDPQLAWIVLLCVSFRHGLNVNELRNPYFSTHRSHVTKLAAFGWNANEFDQEIAVVVEYIKINWKLSNEVR